MMVCQECGNAAQPGDEFCASCGALLEWSGQPVPTVVARQPVAEASRPPPEPLVEEPAYGGLYCSACGVRNAEGRVFCRSCGERLSGDVVMQPARVGWWRRLLNRLSGRNHRSAGERPRGFVGHDHIPKAGGAKTGTAGRNWEHVKSLHPNRVRPPRWLALSRFGPLLIIVALIGVGLGPARGWITTHVFGLASKVNSDIHQHYVPISAIRADASSAAPGHGGKLAIDGIHQTYWLTAPGDSHPRLVIFFASPQNIDEVGLLSGEPGGSYLAQARPKTLKISTPGQPGTLISFDDTAGFQYRPVSLHGVTEVIVTVKQVYPGQKGQSVAIRELEFDNKV